MVFSRWISDRIIQAQRWGFVGEVEWSTCFNGTRLSWPRPGPKKVEKDFSFWFLILVPIVGLWVQNAFGRIHEHHTGPFWGICWSNPMQKSCRSSMWSTSSQEKCRCDFPTKSLQDGGRHPKADAETGSGARGLSFHLGNADLSKSWLKVWFFAPWYKTLATSGINDPMKPVPATTIKKGH